MPLKTFPERGTGEPELSRKLVQSQGGGRTAVEFGHEFPVEGRDVEPLGRAPEQRFGKKQDRRNDQRMRRKVRLRVKCRDERCKQFRFPDFLQSRQLRTESKTESVVQVHMLRFADEPRMIDRLKGMPGGEKRNIPFFKSCTDTVHRDFRASCFDNEQTRNGRIRMIIFLRLLERAVRGAHELAVEFKIPALRRNVQLQIPVIPVKNLGRLVHQSALLHKNLLF